MSKSFNSRAVATRILIAVIRDGVSLNDALPRYLPASLRQNDRAFIREICYGAVRWHERLTFVAHRLLHKPLKEHDEDLLILITVGLYQLMEMRVPAHAAVTETVNAARVLKKERASGLINGILRTFLRDTALFQNAVEQDETARFSHPVWLLDLLKTAWPETWKTIAEVNNTRAPMSLRVNLTHQSRSEYVERLSKEGIAATIHETNLTGITLAEPQDVAFLPGFAEGDVSVQDEAAQWAAELLDLAPHQTVLDACAAPGGKTAHILEKAPQLKELVAIDRDADRLKKVTENLERLHLSATLLHADAAKPETWASSRTFDRILLDAPCSGTGVIRRHPDIKIHRRASDIPLLVQQQKNLLEALWPLLTPGGILLYATCSVLPQENDQLLKSFLEEHADAREKPIDILCGKAVQCGRQLFPTCDGMDGFYYSRLEKLS